MRIQTLILGLAAAAAFGGPVQAGTLGACIWGRLSGPDQTRILSAYQKDMGAGAAALQKLDARLKPRAAACAKRGDVPADWVQTLAGAEAVQSFTAAALASARHIDRPKLDAAWSAAPAEVTACVRANGRLAFYSNGLGCSNPRASSWLLQRLGVAASDQPAARQALWYFNAKAIGAWGDQLVGQLPVKPR